MTDHAKRAAMNGLYADLRRRTAVPRWVVKAYVAASFSQADRSDACARAHFGVPMAGLGSGGRECVLAWVAALAQAALAAPDRRAA
jgi:hypothetical protein